MSEELTFLEEFIQSVETVPNDIRRNFELVKELDRDSAEMARECVDIGLSYVREISKKRDRNEALEKALMVDYTTKRQKTEKDTNEKIAVAEQTLALVESFLKKLDNDLATFENVLRGGGDFEVVGAEPGQEVAVQPDAFEKEWILGRVIAYHKDTGFYDVSDVDDEGRYSLPECQVLRLDQQDLSKKFSKGEEVLAVYPDTTAFYQATIVQGTRKSNTGIDQTVTVHFFGDADEFGDTPSRVVPVRYLIRL